GNVAHGINPKSFIGGLLGQSSKRFPWLKVLLIIGQPKGAVAAFTSTGNVPSAVTNTTLTTILTMKVPTCGFASVAGESCLSKSRTPNKPLHRPGDMQHFRGSTSHRPPRQASWARSAKGREVVGERSIAHTGTTRFADQERLPVLWDQAMRKRLG